MEGIETKSTINCLYSFHSVKSLKFNKALHYLNKMKFLIFHIFINTTLRDCKVINMQGTYISIKQVILNIYINKLILVY